MAELNFEGQLERLFSEAPAMRDAEVFRLQVLDRLDRGWTARRFLIGAMGVTGGLIGSAQLIGTGAIGQMRALGAETSGFLNQHLAETSVLPAGVTLDAEVIWLTLALAVVAGGLGLARVIRDI